MAAAVAASPTVDSCSNPPVYDTLVLSGGGIFGNAHVGACWVLEQHGLLKPIKRMIGTSIGALICALLAMRFPVLCIEEYLTGRHILDMSLEQPSFSGHLFGFHESLLRSFRFFVERVLGPQGSDITFSQVYNAFHVELEIVTVSYTEKNVFIFSNNNTPDIPIVHAVAASMAYPELVGSITIEEMENCYFVDGGVLYNFPIGEAPGPKTIGICVQSPFSCDDVPPAQKTSRTKLRIAYWLNFFTTLANKFYLQLRGMQNEDDCEATIVRIPMHNDFSPLDMRHDRAMLFLLFQLGKTTMEEKILSLMRVDNK